jgi:hypothetical protein
MTAFRVHMAEDGRAVPLCRSGMVTTTDDPGKVTCQICQRALARRARLEDLRIAQREALR